MLFLSPGIAYRVQILLHRCDSNAVFIVDVSRVYTIFSSEDGKKQNQNVHTHCISENFQWYTRKKDKNALEIGYQHFKRSPNFNIFVVKYQSFTKFSIRWPVSRYISCKEM